MATAVLAGLLSILPGQLAAAQRTTENRPSFLLASPYGVDNFHAVVRRATVATARGMDRPPKRSRPHRRISRQSS
jgi:hypothetical protein